MVEHSIEEGTVCIMFMQNQEISSYINHILVISSVLQAKPAVSMHVALKAENSSAGQQSAFLLLRQYDLFGSQAGE